MTLLLAGSIVLIAGSAVALIAGWVNAEETFIWTSIAATAAAAVLLVIAFYRSKATAAVLSGDEEKRGADIDPEILADREERANSKYARQTSRGEEETQGSAQTQVLAPDAPPPGGPAEDDGSAEGSAATAATVGPPAGEGPAQTGGNEPDTKAMGAGAAEQPDAGAAEPETAEATDTKAMAAGDAEQPDAGAADARGADAGTAEQPDAGDAEDRDRR